MTELVPESQALAARCRETVREAATDYDTTA
jgi:hypothetical protein